MEKENDGTLITLLDEDGKEQEFEHLGTVEYNGSSYVALTPCHDSPAELLEDTGDLVILKITEDEDGEDILSSIDDDDEFEAVAAQFEELLDGDYDIDAEEEMDDTSEDDG